MRFACTDSALVLLWDCTIFVGPEIEGTADDVSMRAFHSKGFNQQMNFSSAASPDYELFPYVSNVPGWWLQTFVSFLHIWDGLFINYVIFSNLIWIETSNV